MTIRRLSLTAGLGLALVAAACHQDELFRPAVPAYTGGELFQRYVSMGNSLTAGWQSGGINDSLQRVAYPVLVAAAMGGDPFYYPSLNNPGCPPPYTNVFTNTRLGGLSSTFCAFRGPTIPPYVSNVAVPGAEVLDLFQNGPGAGTNSNALTQLMLGGRTQIQAMMAAQPTFVSLWIGNNDVLGAATNSVNGGDSTLITPVSTFQTEYGQVVDSIKATGAKAILIGVANVTAIPFFSQGQTYVVLQAGGKLPPPPFLTLGPNCAPRAAGGNGDSVLVPFPFGAPKVDSASKGSNVTITCTEPQTVQPAELRKLVSTVNAYNTFMSSEATTNNWAYLDVNPTLDSLKAIATQVAAFPGLTSTCAQSPFGLAFSCDGVHPSTATHRLIAKKVVQAINAFYSSAIPPIP